MKREAFKGLTELYRNRVAAWNRADRKARVVTVDKEIECVYRQSQKKGNIPYILRVCQWFLKFQKHHPRPAYIKCFLTS